MEPPVAPVSDAPFVRPTSAWWIPVWIVSALVSLFLAATTQGVLLMLPLHSYTWGLNGPLFWTWIVVWLFMAPSGLAHFAMVCARRASATRRRLLVAQAVAMALYLLTTWGYLVALGVTDNLYVL